MRCEGWHLGDPPWWLVVTLWAIVLGITVALASSQC